MTSECTRNDTSHLTDAHKYYTLSRSSGIGTCNCNWHAQSSSLHLRLRQQVLLHATPLVYHQTTTIGIATLSICSIVYSIRTVAICILSGCSRQIIHYRATLGIVCHSSAMASYHESPLDALTPLLIGTRQTTTPYGYTSSNRKTNKLQEVHTTS